MPLVFCFYISRPGYLFNAPFNCAQRPKARNCGGFSPVSSLQTVKVTNIFELTNLFSPAIIFSLCYRFGGFFPTMQNFPILSALNVSQTCCEFVRDGSWLRSFYSFSFLVATVYKLSNFFLKTKNFVFLKLFQCALKLLFCSVKDR